MKKYILLFISLSLCFLVPIESSARKKRRRVYKKKWSISLTNGYSFYQYEKKGDANDPMSIDTNWGGQEGQMYSFFSSLDISRNFGYYEVGAKIQNLGPTFVSPFVKINLTKNNSTAKIVPSVTLGVVPSFLAGVWLRAGLGLSLNRYISFTPFVGAYAWHKLKEDPKYEKLNLHVNTGLSINLYY